MKSSREALTACPNAASIGPETSPFACTPYLFLSSLHNNISVPLMNFAVSYVAWKVRLADSRSKNSNRERSDSTRLYLPFEYSR